MRFSKVWTVFFKRCDANPRPDHQPLWHFRRPFGMPWFCVAFMLITGCSHQPIDRQTDKEIKSAAAKTDGQDGELMPSDTIRAEPARLDAVLHLPHRIKRDIEAAGLTQDDIALFISPMSAQPPEKNHIQQQDAFEHHTNQHLQQHVQLPHLVSINAHHPMNPASTMKLVTTASALGLLALTYQAQTSIWIEPQATTATPDILQGPLYLKGQGSATFDRGQLLQLLEQLWLRGYRHIPAGLVFDRDFFQPSREDLTAAPFDESPLALYNLIPDSLLFDEGIQRIMLRSNHHKLDLALSPVLHHVKIDTQQVKLTGPCGRWRYPGNLRFKWHMGNSHHRPFTPPSAIQPMVAAQHNAISTMTSNPLEMSDDSSALLQVSGQFPANCQQQVFAPWFNRDDQLALFIAQSWQHLGGTLGRNDQHKAETSLSRSGSVPADAMQVAALPSLALTEWIRRINKYSDNPLARSLFLTLGQPCLSEQSQRAATSSFGTENDQSNDAKARTGSPQSAPLAPNETATQSSRTCARERIVQYLSDQSINPAGIVLDNGSGLSRQERISAKQLADVIQMAYQHHTGHEFIASLPIAGMDGTMKRRLSQACLAGRLRLKTGSLRDVTSIAGVYLAKSGTPYVIVVMINGNLTNTRARQMIDSWLWQYLSAITPECPMPLS